MAKIVAIAGDGTEEPRMSGGQMLAWALIGLVVILILAGTLRAPGRAKG